MDNVDGETYEFSVTIPTAGVHTVYDALAAYTAATRLGLERARAARALASYQTTGMRQNIVQHGGVTFIEDCYNASPDSMKAALQILHDRQPGPGGRRIAVLGDMLELGDWSDAEHRHIISLAAEIPDARILLVGPHFAKAYRSLESRPADTTLYPSQEVLAAELRKHPVSQALILVKGSHSIGLERLADLL